MEVNTQVVDQKALTCSKQAEAITVIDNNQYVYANNFIKGLNDLLKEIDSTFNQAIQNAFRLHRELVAKKKEHAQPVENAIKTVKQKIVTYLQECERKRRLEEARLQEEARKKVEEEAKKIAESLPKEEAEELIREAKEFEPMVIAPKQDIKIDGTFTRKEWAFEITDPMQIKRDYLIPDEKTIRAFVKGKGKMAEQIIGGIKVFQRESLVVKK